MLFVNKKKKRLKSKLKTFTNKGIIVNLRIYINSGLSVYLCKA